MSNLKSPFLRVVAPWADIVEKVMKMLGMYEFMPSWVAKFHAIFVWLWFCNLFRVRRNDMMVEGGKFVCQDSSPFKEVCANALFLLCGFNSEQLDRSLIPQILENTPAGASVDQLVHYAQGINSAKFRMFDFGLTKNMLAYGSFSPPDYNLKAITAPVYLHYSENLTEERISITRNWIVMQFFFPSFQLQATTTGWLRWRMSTNSPPSWEIWQANIVSQIQSSIISTSHMRPMSRIYCMTVSSA